MANIYFDDKQLVSPVLVLVLNNLDGDNGIRNDYLLSERKFLLYCTVVVSVAPEFWQTFT